MLELLERCKDFGLLLAADPPADAKGDPNIRMLWSGLLLVGALLIGALLISWIQRWHRRMTSDTPAEGTGSFRDAFERGELTEEEYKRILNRMGGAKSPSPARPERTSPPMIRPTSEGRTPETPTAE